MTGNSQIFPVLKKKVFVFFFWHFFQTNALPVTQATFYNSLSSGTSFQLAPYHNITIQFRWIIKLSTTPEYPFFHPATPTPSHYLVVTPSSIHGICHSRTWCDCWWIPVSWSQKFNTSGHFIIFCSFAVESMHMVIKRVQGNVDFMRCHLFS